MKTFDEREKKLFELQAMLTTLKLELNNLENRMGRVTDTMSDMQDLILDIKYGELYVKA